MRKTLGVLGLTCLILVALDLGMALFLSWAEARGRVSSLVQYFEYGRSVPGKLARWEAGTAALGGLYGTAWRPAIVADSAEAFAIEPALTGPVIRSYGMSFANNILRAAQGLQPGLQLDMHAGPQAPPNFTYALFQDDAANRRPGDIVVLAILSSSAPGMAALSNQTWAFEQPAPFTYPIYRPDGDWGLQRIDPVIENEAAHRALVRDPAGLAAWHAQLAEEDAFYGPVTYGARLMDGSPLCRLIRRSLAIGNIRRIEQDIQTGDDYPLTEALGRMISAFAGTIRAEGQRPVVMLIQSGDPGDLDLLAALAPVLARDKIPYLATAEHVDPRDAAGFAPDGHYLPAADAVFARAFLRLIN